MYFDESKIKEKENTPLPLYLMIAIFSSQNIFFSMKMTIFIGGQNIEKFAKAKIGYSRHIFPVCVAERAEICMVSVKNIIIKLL